MHILYLCQYFPPEMGAPAARAYEFGRRWVQAGHKVTVVCGIPNHPHGQVYEGYNKRIRHHEVIDGIDVYRSWVYVTPNSGFTKRTLNYISFGISSILNAEHVPQPDVLIATSPQFFTGLSGTIVRKLRHIPFVLEIRDLWPDSIEAVDIKLSATVMRSLRMLEKFMYRQADKIVVVSDAFRQHIISAGVASEDIFWVPNGVNTNLFKEQSATRTHFADIAADSFLVGYIGTHGMAMGLDTMINAARHLKDREDIHFVLVGEGAEKQKLKKAASNLTNVTFVDRQPRETVARMLSELDVALVLLKKAELLKTVIPSKMFEIMGAGKPMILGVEGEAQRIMLEADAGIAIEPENETELVEAILGLKNDKTKCAWYGINASKYVRKMFNLDTIALTYLSVLQSIAP